MDINVRLREAREERHAAFERMKQLDTAAEGRELKAEETQEWERLDGRLVELGGEDGKGGEIARLERQAQRYSDEDEADKRGRTPIVDDEERGSGEDAEKVYRSYTEFAAEQRSAPQDQPANVEAFYRFLQTGGGQVGHFAEADQRALAEATGPEGGYTVPTTTRAQLVEKQTSRSRLRELVTSITTGTGEDLKIPLEASIGSAQMRAENVAVTDSDIVFGLATLRAYIFSTLIYVPRGLLNDTIIDLEAYIARVFARRMALLQSPKFFSGTGTGEPRGVLQDYQVGLTKAVAASPVVKADDAIDLYFSVQEEYRDQGVWLGDGTVLKSLRKEKDSNGQYIWETSTQAGQPDLLLGKPVREDAYMPDLAPDTRVLAFGNWADSTIVRDVADVHMQRLVELRAREGQVGFLFEQRSDIAVVNPEAVKVLKTGLAA